MACLDCGPHALYVFYGRIHTVASMSLAAQPILQPGKTYRTRDLYVFGANPTRLAHRLIKEGRLIRAASGVFYAPIESEFGKAPPSDHEILRGFLNDSPFIVTGPPVWNLLGLGSTALFATTLVYNMKRTGEFILDSRRFLLRRVCFPNPPPPEWFIVDLIQHHKMAGICKDELESGLTRSLQGGKWKSEVLLEMARRYGTRLTFEIICRSLEQAGRTRCNSSTTKQASRNS